MLLGSPAGSGLSVPMVWQRHPFFGPNPPVAASIRPRLLPAVRGGASTRSQRVFRGGPRRSWHRLGCSCRWARGRAVFCRRSGLDPVKGLFVLVFMLASGITGLIRDLSGINYLFAVLLYAGGLVLSIACFYRSDTRRGFYPLLAVMLLLLAGASRATTSLNSSSSGS